MESENTQVFLAALHCLPGTAWIKKYMQADAVIIEQHENYQKQSFRNRYTVMSGAGPLTLNIPVIGGRSSTKVLYRDIRIDHSENPGKTHVRTLYNCYARAPYFEHYMPYFEPLLLANEERLWDMNVKLLELMLKLAGIKSKHSYSTGFTPYGSPEDGREMAGRRYIPTVELKAYPVLYEVFFEKNLSFIDALFLFGPDATQMI